MAKVFDIRHAVAPINGYTSMNTSNIKTFGLPRSRKIIKADAFASALRMRVCARTEYFVLHFMAHRSHPSALTQAHAQLGLVMPKRLAKYAVRRNTLKRLTRECFRLRAVHLPAGLWVVRLQRNVNALTLTSAQKKIWAEELMVIFDQGQAFAAQFATPPSVQSSIRAQPS